MKNKRREFLKLAGLAGLGVAGGNFLGGFAYGSNKENNPSFMFSSSNIGNNAQCAEFDERDTSIIGLYGPWAAGLIEKKLPALSFRRKESSDLDTWRKAARKRLVERMSIPDIGRMPAVTVNKEYAYDGLHIEELTWQLPYGRPTEAIVLKPLDKKGPMPGILAFHDHGGNKYFGTRKITRTADIQHPLIAPHQKEYYEDFAWANEIAKRGYVVLVSDAFPFASRRVMLQDVPAHLRRGLTDANPEDPVNIKAYNAWAGDHEHTMSKSLLSAGTTWAGVFLAEDRKALDVLCARKDVDVNRVGCGGLSGGGMRTVFMAGLDPRIRCAVCVGFMTTWEDLINDYSARR